MVAFGPKCAFEQYHDIEVMAAPSGDDIPSQLATLLGRDAVQIRRTNENPPRISIIDVARAITGHNADYSGQAVRNVCEQYPEVREKITDVRFPDALGHNF